MTVLKVLQAATAALTRADVATLLALAEETSQMEEPRTAEEAAELERNRRVLERLLVLTRRNLTVLRRGQGLGTQVW